MDKLTVKVETVRKLPDPEYEKLVQATLESKLGIPIEAEMVPVGAIPLAPVVTK